MTLLKTFNNSGAPVIDKSSERLWEAAGDVSPEGYDMILDANGKLPPMPITTCPFEEPAKAHVFMGSGRRIEKLVLTVSPNR